MAEVYTKEEVDKLLEPLRRELDEIKTQQPVTWIDREEAMQLTGRSKSWFYKNRFDLPIAMMPRAEGDRRIRYSKADCITYGIKHRILPPREVSHSIQFPPR